MAHAPQAMRFGNDLEGCLKAIQIGFELSPRPSDTIYQGAVKTLEMVSSLPQYFAGLCAATWWLRISTSSSSYLQCCFTHSEGS